MHWAPGAPARAACVFEFRLAIEDEYGHFKDATCVLRFKFAVYVKEVLSHGRSDAN